MIIRPASEKDLPEFVQLMKELGYPVDEEQMKERLENIKRRNGRVFTAVDETQNVLGCVHAFIDLRLAEGETGEIVSLVVKQDVRGRGIGSMLLNEAIKWIHETGCDKVRIRANAIREDAHEFYNHHGFKEIKTQKVFQKNIM